MPKSFSVSPEAEAGSYWLICRLLRRGLPDDIRAAQELGESMLSAAREGRIRDTMAQKVLRELVKYAPS